MTLLVFDESNRLLDRERTVSINDASTPFFVGMDVKTRAPVPLHCTYDDNPWYNKKKANRPILDQNARKRCNMSNDVCMLFKGKERLFDQNMSFCMCKRDNTLFWRLTCIISLPPKKKKQQQTRVTNNCTLLCPKIYVRRGVLICRVSMHVFHQSNVTQCAARVCCSCQFHTNKTDTGPEAGP